MSYSVILTDNFKREAKKLTKKYKSLKNELEILGNELTKDPTSGTSLGNNVYKIRLAIASKDSGKSGGARIITYVKMIDKIVYLVSIFDKSQLDTLTKDQIFDLLKKADLL